MSQIQCIIREVIAKADVCFVEYVLNEAVAQEILGNHEDAASLLNEAILIQEYHLGRMLLAA